MSQTTIKKPHRAPARTTWLRKRRNPLWDQPDHRFYAMLVYRLLIAGMITAVVLASLLTTPSGG